MKIILEKLWLLYGQPAIISPSTFGQIAQNRPFWPLTFVGKVNRPLAVWCALPIAWVGELVIMIILAAFPFYAKP